MGKFELKFIQLEVTAQCNLRCIHCYSESDSHAKSRNALNLQDFKKIAIDGYRLGARRIQVIGGEAALWPETPNLLYYLREIGYSDIEYYSNLTILPLKVRTALQDTKSRVAVTLMSDDPSIHDGITKSAGSWAATISNIKDLAKTNEIRGSVVTFANTEDSAARTIDLFRSLGVVNSGIDRVRPVGRARDDQTGSGYIPSKPMSFEDIAPKLCGACAAGSIYITSSGQVHFCAFSREVPIGNIIDNELKSIVSSASFYQSHEALSAALGQSSIKTSDSDDDVPRCRPEAENCPPGPCGPIRISRFGDIADHQSSSPRCRPEWESCPPGTCGPVRISETKNSDVIWMAHI